MPLAEHLPRLDNRRFDDIVAEARARIPSYAPEWTDLNDNEPGMALVQLFAWMTDMLLYRMGRVPELNYLKFLELIGIELRPAASARVEVTFPVKETHTAAYVTVPLRQQVAAEGEDGGRVVFETERSLVALRARLAAVQRRAGATYQRLTEMNEEASRAWQPFGNTPAVDDTLLLGFSEALPGGVEVSLFFWSADPEDAPEPLQCGPASAATTPASLAWEYWSGSRWESMTLLADDTRALTRSGAVHLRAPAAPASPEMQAEVIGQVEDSLYWVRARLTRSAYQTPPALAAVRTNTVAAVQAQTVENEVLGGSDGTPNQEFTTRFTPVLAGTLRVEVDEGELDASGQGFREWTEVTDFHGSGPDDRHYVLNRATGRVLFGDGVNGRIPVANVRNPGGSVVARVYRHGGGTAGNVAAGGASTLLTSVSGIDTGAVANLRVGYGGQDEESLDEARTRAALTVKSNGRAVTAEDFEQHAMEAAGIRRAKALPLHHPQFPGVPLPGVVTVIVVPDGEAANPTPTESTLATVCALLDGRRLLTTEVYVVGPTYVRVEAEVEVVAADDADTAQVQTAVEEALLGYFHPLTGGENGQGWPFGRTIFYSQVYQRVFAVAGVERIETLKLRLDGREYPACENVPVPEAALVYSTAHSVRVSYDYDA
ncbi:MAG TPA: putative baseplate assembly protein [Longimicrobiaceae bacterium]|nr:putative baseplate assembly protein [Longimicrobiaceae bacterium]